MHRVSQVGTDETDNNSDYFKRSIWLPYLDAVIVHMQDKFSRTSQTAFLLSSVLTCQKVQKENFKKVFAMYGKFIDCFEEVLYEELLDFVAYRKSSISSEQKEKEKEESATSSSPSMLDAFATAPKRFVNIRNLLRIATTLPLTSCSAERCFSAMKILKSRLRSTMNDDRLNGLALMYIHKDKEISIEDVINNFALGNRKLDFAL
jgi:hypothetical protein